MPKPPCVQTEHTAIQMANFHFQGCCAIWNQSLSNIRATGERHTRRYFPRCLARENIACDVDKVLWPDRNKSFFVRFYSFSRLLWHIFPFTVYFFKAAHTQPLTEAEMTKTLYDVCRMTPPSQNLSHTHQNQTFPSKPTICVQLKMYVFSFI